MVIRQVLRPPQVIRKEDVLLLCRIVLTELTWTPKAPRVSSHLLSIIGQPVR